MTDDERDAELGRMRDALGEDAPLLDAADAVVLDLLADCLVQWHRARADLRDHGWKDRATGEPRALEARAASLRREALDYCRELGLTPRSRLALGLDLARSVDLATAMSESDPERRARLLLEAGFGVEDES